MVIAHNLNAMNAQRQYNMTGLNRKKSTEKLSSGYKINRAADDAAGLAVSEKMRRQIRGLDRGTENMQDGVSFLQIGDGAMGEVHDILQRINQLAVHGANGTLSRSDREAIDAEVQQLKTEINRINETTKFNELRIFSGDTQEPGDNGEVVIKDLGLAPKDLKIFDATYDSTTGAVTYGGIVFRGERISWPDLKDKIPNSTDLVYIDPADGKQKFNEGTWVLMDGQNKLLTLSARQGDEVPNIRRSFDISADYDGVHIDGEIVPWEEIKNEDGQSVTNSSYVNGTWTANFHGSNFTFEVRNAFNGIPGMIAAINKEHDENLLNVYATYYGSSPVQAVDADINRKGVALLTTGQAQTVGGMIASANPDEKSYILRADAAGLWLQDAKGADIAGSNMTWEELTGVPAGGSAGTNGKPPWDSGSYIDGSTFTYADPNGGTGVSFTFTMSDITSVDSVIDGLDGVTITPANIRNKYQMEMWKDTTDPNVKHIQLTHSTTNVTLQNEIDLGRDFSDRFDTFAPDPQPPSNGALRYDTTDPSDPKAVMTFGNGTLVYEGSVSQITSSMDQVLQAYEKSVIDAKKALAMAGANPNVGQQDLSDVLGSQYVSPSGTMQDPNVPGVDYPAGWIDFACLDAATDPMGLLRQLIGNGFDSTCGTCTRHYSFKFVDDAGPGTTTSGLKFMADKSDYDNPRLEISISSLEKMLASVPAGKKGEEMAKAMEEIATAAGFDDHFQKYQVDGTKFFVRESRKESGWSEPGGAQFFTKPYNADATKTYNLTLTSPAQPQNPSNGSQSLNYQYDHAAYADDIQVNMVSNANGGYVQKVTGGYEPYDPTQHAGMPRFEIEVTYANGNAADTRKAFVDNALQAMIRATTASLETKDYTRVDYSGDEKANVAIDSLFHSYSTSVFAPSRRNLIKGEESIQIQKSGDVPNRLMIPRFSLNCSVLGLNRANCLSQGNSRNTIEMVGRALECMCARRSLYGALQNSIEHAISCNKNTGENTTAAESRIRDTDMAEEMVSQSKYSILEQAGQAMMAQANRTPQDVLSLLQ